ncbi:MAG: hypothetical protein A3F18_05550 [Legionellales bacterium RIFCSPHIGHO2_12_FULL_37_14]|nr:MAG: hypothetical protein A3F18_05550 [Legionellales bacterium RIFCSPHIGHO2_12_FULL_37_14]
MSNNKAYRLLILIIFLAGCQGNTTHFTSRVTIQKKWSTKDSFSSQRKNNTPLPCLPWWETFHDKTLNHLVREALIYNNKLNRSRSNVEAATGELKKVKLQWIPNIDYLVGYSQNPAFGFPGFLALFAPSYTINIIQHFQEQKKATHALAAAKAEDDTIRLYVISAIVSAYITYLGELEHEKLIKNYLSDLKHIDSISVEMKNNGLVSQITPEAIHSKVDELQGELEQVEHNIVLSRNAIHYLINSNPNDFSTTYTFNKLKDTYIAPKSLPLTVLRQRPDMRFAIHKLTVANMKIGVASNDLLPEMHLDLFMGPISKFSRYTLPKFMVYFNDQLLRIPVLKLYVLGEIEKATGQRNMAYYAYLDTLQKILQDTTNALSAHDRLSHQLLDTVNSRKHYAKIYKLNLALTKQGIQSNIKTLQTKLLLHKKKIAVNHDKLQSMLAVIKLYQELGGGYHASPASGSRLGLGPT